MHYSNNIKLLRKTNKELADSLDNWQIDMDMINVVETHLPNYYTCKVAPEENEYKLLIHSMVDPVEEAVHRINRVKGLESNYVCIIFGFGFGYDVREILKRKFNKGYVLVIEPRLDILKAALSCMDFSDILCNESVKIIYNDEKFKNNLYQFIKICSHMLKNTIYYQLPVYEYITKGEIKKIRKEYSEMVSFFFTTMGNSPGDTLIGIANMFNNIEYILDSFNITSLRFNGIPAIIVGAGPSLDKNFKLLKNIKERAIIIAAETILEKLLKNDIVPDIVCVLERGDNVFENFFKGKQLNNNIVLCGQCVIETKIFRVYPGKKIVCFKEPVTTDRWFSQSVGGANTFKSGQTVTSMAFSLARIFECDPIVLIGQDLSYGEDGKTHAGETVYEDLEMKDDLELYRDHFTENELIRKVKGNYSDYVITMPYWYQFLKWYEIEIKSTQAKVINATEGGAYIDGTIIMTLEEVIKTYCMKNIEVSLVNRVCEVSKEEKVQRLDAMMNLIDNELSNFKSTKNIIKETIKLCDLIINQELPSEQEYVHIYEKINYNRLHMQEVSKLFCFIIQAIRIVHFQRDTDFSIVTNVRQLTAWTQIQKEYLEDILKILVITESLFLYAYKKTTLLKNGKIIEAIDVLKILSDDEA